MTLPRHFPRDNHRNIRQPTVEYNIIRISIGKFHDDGFLDKQKMIWNRSIPNEARVCVGSGLALEENALDVGLTQEILNQMRFVPLGIHSGI